MSVSGANRAPIPARILLVCPNRSGLAARKAVLEEMGCLVTPAATAEEALEQSSVAGFDLVVTGYRLGKMDGAAMVKRIRAVLPEVRVIMFSGHVEVLGLTESATGADVVLAKGPNEVAHLVRAVSRMLRQRPAKKLPTAEKKALRNGRRAAQAS